METQKSIFTEDPNAVKDALSTLNAVKSAQSASADSTVADAEPVAAVPVQKQRTALQRFNGYLTNTETQNYLAQVLGEKKSVFVNNLVALVSNSTQLQSCKPATVMYAALKATALDLPLDPNLGFAYVIKYGDDAQFQIGYKGFLQLAMRSGQFRTINVRGVRDGEYLGEDFVTGECRFKVRTDARAKGEKYIGYVAFFELLNGFRKMQYWTRAEVEAHGRKFSKAYGYLWTSDFDAMAKKTVIKMLLSKYAPMSIEMRDAVVSDQAVLTSKGARYIDNPGSSVIESDEAAPDTNVDTSSEDAIRMAMTQGRISKEQADSLIADLNK